MFGFFVYSISGVVNLFNFFVFVFNRLLCNKINVFVSGCVELIC